MEWESVCTLDSWYPLYESGKYFPNEVMIGHAATGQSKYKVCDQLEKPIERLKVAEVGHQTALCTVCISISWILCLPLGSVDASSNTRHMQTGAYMQIHNYKETYIYECGLLWNTNTVRSTRFNLEDRKIVCWQWTFAAAIKWFK